MKNQNDLIVAIVAVVLAAGTIIYFQQTPRRVTPLPEVTQPDVSAVKAPQPPITRSPSLPGAGSPAGSSSGGTARRGGGRMRA